MDFRRKPGYRPGTADAALQPASGDPGAENRNHSIMLFHTTALSTALAFALPAWAEDVPVFIGDEIVVTPTRAPQKLSDTLAATTVLTRRDIEASGAIDLPALLQGLPGVEITQAGGFGAQADIRLRGAEADHTLVLVDGLRVNSVSTGTTAIEHLSIDDIERIEIVRGNVSSVYGSEAIGGVVRIFTRQGRGAVSPRVSAGFGTDDFRNFNAGIGGELKPGLRFDLSAGRTESGGFSSVRRQYIPTPWVFDAGDTDDDESRNTHFNFTLSHQLGDSLSWGLSAWQNRADVEYDGSFSNHADQDLAAYSLHVQGRLLDNWVSKLTLGQSSDEYDSDWNGADAGRYHTRINQLLWENTYAAGRHLFRFGAEAQDQKLSSDQVYSEKEREAISAYAGVGVQLGAHDFDLSVRHDHYSDFGGHTTGRAAYGYQFAPALKGYAAVATAFKAPTFNDLYLDFPPFYYSNPDLKPERAESAELGLNYAFGGQFVQAVLFASRTRDLIAIDPVTYATTVNLDRSRNRGLELAWNGKLAGLSARAALTLQNPEDDDSGQALLRRAQRFGRFALSDRVGKFGWQAEVIASGPHPDVHVSNFTRTSVPGYAVLNFSGDYALAPGWKLGARVVNALDADYSLVHGYATPGRQFRLELAYAPK
jgi:vitamin B12 transporter